MQPYLLKVPLQRKDPEIHFETCQVDRVIELRESEFRFFTRNLMQEYDFLREYNDRCLGEFPEGVRCGVLVLGQGSDDGVFVCTEGYDYARYSAYIPNARQIMMLKDYPALQDYSVKMKRLADASAGVYKVVLTDENNVINNDFPYTNGNGLTFSKSGNKLTVTATPAALQNAPVTVMSVGSNPDVEDASPVIWGTSNSNHNQGQILCQMAEPDPVPCYFKLTAPTTTTLTIQKVCDDGNIAGITFTVKDSAGTTLFTGQTDAAGKLDVPNLRVGETVTVTETVPENYVSENRTQTITLAETGNVLTFRNYPLGTAALRKTSDSSDVEGYCFNLYRKKSDSYSSRTWHGKSDTDGRIYKTDSSYEVLGSEKSYVFKGLTDGTYHFREALSLHGAGNVWPESVTFETSGGSTAPCSLTFTGDELTKQSNGDCTVSGVALTGLDGGGALTITIKNEPVPVGSITVKKVDGTGKALKGVTFLLEYSIDGGSTWTPVSSRGENGSLTPGGCTSAGLNNGKLTTESDGFAAFTGLCVETDESPVLYRLTETETKPGYSLLAEPAFEGPLPEDAEYAVTLTAVNMPSFQMPATGGRGFGFTALGISLALLSTGALVVLLRKKKMI